MKKCNVLLPIIIALMLSNPLSGAEKEKKHVINPADVFSQSYSKSAILGVELAGIGLVSTGILLPVLLPKAKTKKQTILKYLASVFTIGAGIVLILKPNTPLTLSDRNFSK